MTDLNPPFYEKEFWEKYVGTQAVSVMGAATTTSQPFLPPEGHAMDIQTPYRAIINIHKFTCQYLNFQTRGMPENDATNLVEEIVREAIETTRLRSMPDGSPVRIYMRQMTSYLSGAAVILDEDIHHPLVANRHFVAHYAVY